MRIIINKLWNFINGYVIISLKGFNSKKLINKAVKNGIALSNIFTNSNEVSLVVAASNVKSLIELNKDYKCKIKIENKKGLNFILYRISKKYFFILGMAIFVISLLFLSSRVWLINIQGNSEIENSQIIECCNKNKLSLGVGVNSIDTKKIAYELKNTYTDISWVNVRTKGSTAFIKLAEEQNKKKPTIEANQPCDIVSNVDCIITSIVTRNGQPQVKKGDTVCAGDILVSGQLVKSGKEENEIVRQVHSKADVKGRVIRGYNFTLPYSYNQKTYTGNTRTTYSIKIFNKILSTDFIDKKQFSSYDKGITINVLNLGNDYYLPFAITKIVYKEYIINSVKITEAQAKSLAQSRVSQHIINDYPVSADILDCKIKYKNNNNSLAVETEITSNEFIGTENTIQVLGGNLLNGST